MNRLKTNKKLIIVLFLCAILLSFTLMSCISPETPIRKEILVGYEQSSQEIEMPERLSVSVPRIITITEIYEGKEKIGTRKGELMYDQFMFEENQYVYYHGYNSLRVNDHEWDDTTFIEFTTTAIAHPLVDENGIPSKDGEIDYATSFEFKVTKNRIPAESVEAFTSVSWVEAGDGMALNSRLLPQNASYKNVTFQIEFVIVDNQKITDQDKIEVYAEIDTSSGSIDSATLLTKKTLSAGDKIAISAYAPCDDIHSQTLAEIEVRSRIARP